MKRMLFLVLLTAMLVSAVDPAGAAVFERDWQTPGDGLLTYDDVNRREWLDLSASRLDQFSEPRLENAIAQITPGGIFEGFTWANRDDVRAFAQSGGIDTSTSSLAINLGPMNEMIDLLGSTFEIGSPAYIRRSVGFIDELDTNPILPRQIGALFLININPTTGGGFAGLSFSSGHDSLFDDATGLMLYRIVPEPSTATLVIFSYCGIIFSRCRIHRWKQKKT